MRIWITVAVAKAALIGGYTLATADAEARMIHAVAEADLANEWSTQVAYDDGYADGWADALAERPVALEVCAEDEVQVWGTGACWPMDDSDYITGYGWIPRTGPVVVAAGL